MDGISKLKVIVSIEAGASRYHSNESAIQHLDGHSFFFSQIRYLVYSRNSKLDLSYRYVRYLYERVHLAARATCSKTSGISPHNFRPLDREPQQNKKKTKPTKCRIPSKPCPCRIQHTNRTRTLSSFRLLLTSHKRIVRRRKCFIGTCETIE